MNKIICTAAAAVIAAGCTFAVYAQAGTPPAAGAATGQAGHAWKQHGERHPELRRAISKLEHAKEDLHEGSHDFGGHRAKALEHVEAALGELHQALEYEERGDNNAGAHR